MLHLLRVLTLALVLGTPVLASAAPEHRPAEISFAETLKLAEAGQLKSVRLLDDRQARVTTMDGRSAVIRTPVSQAWAIDLAKSGTDVEFGSPEVSALSLSLGIFGLVAQVLVLALIVGMAVWLLRTVRSKSKIGEFIKPGDPKSFTRFDHVAGADEGKQALRDIVAYLKDPSKFEAVGARARSGVLLEGDPGNGKTLLAKAVAGEAGVPFLSVSGSAFQEMFAGVGAARVRSIFKQLRKRAPCILFIDEIDSVGKRRSDGSSSVENDSANTLNELLTQLDGLGSSAGIVIIGATNRI